MDAEKKDHEKFKNKTQLNIVKQREKKR